MLLHLALMGLAGFCAKAVDDILDRHLDVPGLWAPILASLWGLSLGYLASQTLLAPLLLALAAASILAGKINQPYHLLGTALFAALVGALPLLFFEPWLFAVFLVFALLDELELGRGTPLEALNRERLWTPLAALALALAGFANPLFLLAIVCFDLFYRLGGWVMKWHYPTDGRPPAPASMPARPALRRRRKH